MDAAIYICKAMVGLQALLLGVQFAFSLVSRVFSHGAGD